MKFFLFLSMLLAFGSCQEQYSKQNTEAISDSVSITGITGDSVKLVKIAGISFKVKDVQQSSKAVSELAAQYGGMVFHRNMESIENETKELAISADSILKITTYTPRAEITARVPTENLEAFMQDVTELGYFIDNSKMDVEDRSLSYLEHVLKQKERTKILSKDSAKNKHQMSGAQTIKAKDELIDRQIANMIIDGDVQYSVVNLSLYQNALVQKETAANYLLSGYTLSFSQRFRNACIYGWQYFLMFVLALTEMWMFILVAVIIYMAYKAWSRIGKTAFLNK